MPERSSLYILPVSYPFERVDIDFGPTALAALSAAIQFAHRAGDHYVGAPHILYGIALNDGQDNAAKILKEAGLRYDAIYRTMFELFGVNRKRPLELLDLKGFTPDISATLSHFKKTPSDEGDLPRTPIDPISSLDILYRITQLSVGALMVMDKLDVNKEAVLLGCRFSRWTENPPLFKDNNP